MTKSTHSIITRRQALTGTAAGAAAIVAGTGPAIADNQAVVSELPVSVNDFGAKGDGTTDDSTAIQNAINAGFSVVTVPPGTYIIDAQLIGASNVELIADRATFKAKNSLNANMLVFSGNNSFAVSGLTFDGNSANQRAGSAILIENCIEFKVTGCHLKDVFSNGVALDAACADFDISHNLLENIGNHAISLSRTTDPSLLNCVGGTIGSNRVHNPTAAGINVSGAERIVVSNNYVYHEGSPSAHSSGYGGIRISNQATDVVVVGNTVRGMSVGVFCLTARRTSIVGNVLTESGAQGVLVADDPDNSPFDQAQDTVVSGNVVYNPGQTAADDGVRIRAALRAIVANNQVTSTDSNMPYGIRVTDSTKNINTDVQVFGNNIAGATTLNIDLPTGIGAAQLGPHSALSGEIVTGYIEVKDSGGTVRKLAVMS